MRAFRNRLLAGVTLAALASPPQLWTQQPASSRGVHSGLGFSTARLARIDSALQRAVDRGEIAGAVALVLRDGRTAYERAVGWADREARRPMTGDAIFRIDLAARFPMLVYQALVGPRG